MTFETYTEAGVYNRTASTTITRSKFSGITNIDNYLTTPYAQKTGNIPIEDANFKAYLVSKYDTNGDGEISYDEADAITSLSPGNDYFPSRVAHLETNCTAARVAYNIALQNEADALAAWQAAGGSDGHYKDAYLAALALTENKKAALDAATEALDTITNSVQGIEFMPNLEYLDALEGYLETLDVSNNTALKEITCAPGRLTSLDISNNTALERLNCSSNQLTTLDLSNNTALVELFCSNNQLTSLDLSNNTALTRLQCPSNQLTSLDITNNTALFSLNCGGNQLTYLDVSNNTALADLSCNYNQLTTLDITNNIALISFNCGSNQLTSLDVSNNVLLEYLACSSNQFTSLDISNNTALVSLDCRFNQLTSLDLSNNTALVELWCHENQLTSLNLSANTVLQRLYCWGNQITTLDVSRNTALTTLDCAPMASLETLKIAQGQEIPKVTSNRSEDYIPAETQIVIAPVNGGNEGAGDEEVNP
jgi:hypothetical protein